MTYLKTGLIASTLIIFLAMMFLTYNILGIRTVVDLFIIPAFIINISLVVKIFRKKEEVVL